MKNSEYLAQQEPELYEMIRLRLIVDEPFRAFIEFVPLSFFSSIEKIAKGNKESKYKQLIEKYEEGQRILWALQKFQTK